MKSSLSSFVFGILFAGALSMGCVAQTGTDDSSQAEGLTSDQAQPAEQQAAPQQAAPQQALTMKQRARLAPQTTLTQPAVGTSDVPKIELEGIADPGGNVEDDGDGKEPDPHPWYSCTTARAGH